MEKIFCIYHRNPSVLMPGNFSGSDVTYLNEKNQVIRTGI